VSDARTARDELARERVRRGLRQALKSLRQAAESFGEQDVADFVASHNDAVVRLDGRALESLEEVATLLAQPGGASDSLTERLDALRLKRGGTPAAPPAVVPTVIPTVTATPMPPAAPVAPTPRPVAPPPRPAAFVTPSGMMTPISGAPIFGTGASDLPPAPAPRPTPAGSATVGAASAMRNTTPSKGAAALGELLDRGIRTLGTLPQTPLSNPVTLAEQPPVPIDVLLYRGRAAIERAREIRDAIKRSGGVANPETLGELYDLLDLALTD
jgi:hypothetical protein